MSQRLNNYDNYDSKKNPGPGSYNPNFWNKMNITSTKIGTSP